VAVSGAERKAVSSSRKATTYPARPKTGTKRRWWAAAAVTTTMLALCGSCLGNADADEPATGPAPQAATPQTVVTTLPATVTESPTSEPSETPSESPSSSPAATLDAVGDCLRRGRLSAEVKYFGDDPTEYCNLLPSYDFGITVKQYDGCVRKARTFHVTKTSYQSTCRYNHTYQWTKYDDPTYDPYADDDTDDSYNDGDTGEADDGYDYGNDDTGSDDTSGDTDTGSGGDTVDDGSGSGSDPHAGCTWVDDYYRKNGNHVRGYWRC
jgi:hypothetical protein